MANQDLEVNIEVVKNIFRSEKTSIQGKFSHYEETYDGTASGWYKFRKDLASAVGNDEIQIEIKQDGNWVQIKNGAALDKALQPARTTKKLEVRISNLPSSYGTLALVTTAFAFGIMATVYTFQYLKLASTR